MLALTRSVPPSIHRCELTHVARVPIDATLAARQHGEYERLLQSLGCRVRRLQDLPDCPDSVFVEDTAVVLDEIAIVTRPGAESRRDETASVVDALREHRALQCIEAPGTLDGGDVLPVGRRVFVGRSGRTNDSGIEQLARWLGPLGYAVRPVRVVGCLHLKTAVSSLGDGRLLVDPRCVMLTEFDGLTTIDVDSAEPEGANVLFVNGTVICPASAPRTRAKLRALGYRVATHDASELAKAEAGLTCCSLLVNDAGD